MKAQQLIRFLGVVFAVTALSGSSAFAGAKFSAFGVANWASIRGGGVTLTGDMAFGGGAGIEFGLGKMVGLEIDGIFNQFKFGGVTSKAIGAPVFLRIWANRFLTLGAGGYFGYSLESAVTDKVDYGLTGVAGFNVPISHSVAIIAEGRYYYGLKDDNGFKSSDIQAVAGLRFGLSK